MTKNLVVVESPAKATTLSKMLGKDYKVTASMGHVRDLPQKKLGVDVEGDFTPEYVVPAGKKKVVKEIKDLAKTAQTVFLATDPDREGEAISWHLVKAAGLDKMSLKRVVFHEITQEAVTEAFRHPRAIDERLVDAQQARRILDRLVGYKISPVLWRKIRPGLSAGRVQSVALRLIVDRENEIKGFVPVEYWSIEAELEKEDRQGFRAALVSAGARKKIDLKDEAQTHKVVADLEKAAYSVSSVRQKKSSRQPAPPFITSTLQQEAWNKLGFSAKRTMAIAQQLYEGMPMGKEDPVGLITYMRTDSTRVSTGALAEARDYIGQKYGERFVPKSARQFTRKVKSAQEAHEAIRPTSAWREPDQISKYLNAEQNKLYTLVWQRMIASQMAAAEIDTTTIDIGAKAKKETYVLRATSSSVAFPGFLVLYSVTEDEESPDKGKRPLPDLAEGENLKLMGLFPEQHFTQPPPRYTEASLIKALEENGIGRPSTYAPIMSLIQERGYVDRQKGKLLPAELGVLVDGLLREAFSEVVDIGFTAQMEEDLDRIASGEKEWVPMLREFYAPFEKKVATATTTLRKVSEPTDEVCEKCGQPMVIKWGRFGKFLSCSAFPECKNARPLAKPAPVTIGVPCPKCGGELIEKRSRKGKVFFGCSSFPKCDFASWNRPLPQPCPKCKGLLTQAGKDKTVCAACGYKGMLEEAEELVGAGKGKDQ